MLGFETYHGYVQQQRKRHGMPNHLDFVFFDRKKLLKLSVNSTNQKQILERKKMRKYVLKVTGEGVV